MAAPTSNDSSAPRLRMAGIRKRFGATVALDGVDLQVEAGQVLALIGENGAGKSTLMKTLSGAHAPDEGEMWLDGKPYRPRTPGDARQAGVAMIYQELSLAPHLSVMENIVLGMEPTRGPLIDWPKVRATAARAMEQMGRPDVPLNIPVKALSVADRQLVEIARAVAVGARVLVLDEPTSSLTARDIELLFALVRRLKSQGMAIIYISHFLEEVEALGDVFTVLRDGRSVGAGRVGNTSRGEIIEMMVGRQVESLYPRTARTPGEEVLSVDHLSSNSRLTNATFSLRRGEVLGIAGLIGAGRTELLRAIFGLDEVKTGQVRVKSFTGPASPGRRWDEGLGLVSEDRKTEGLALSLSIADNLTLSKLPTLVSPRRQAEISEKWIQRLKVKCRSSTQPVGDLSGGNQQKVAIARLLHHGVDVLLLDEPTRGIDVGSKAQIYQLIDELAAGNPAEGIQPSAVLMVSSYLPELLGVCDRIAVMCRGRLGEARPVAEVNERQIMAEAIGANPPTVLEK